MTVSRECRNCLYMRKAVSLLVVAPALGLVKYECRYSPPGMDGFPEVDVDDWCGKFEFRTHVFDE